MSRIKRVYFPFAKMGLQKFFAYKLNFLGFFIGEILYCFVMYYVWRAVFESSGSGTFMDFSMNDMVVYLFVSNITSYFASTNVMANVGEEIKDGSVAMRLLKPVNYNISLMFQELGQSLALTCLIIIPTIIGVEIYRFCVSGMLMFNTLGFLLYLLSMIMAYIIAFYLDLCFAFMAFFVKNIWGFSMLKTGIVKFLSGSAIPLAFMPEMLKNILEILPFASLSYTPVMLYMGKYDTYQTIFCLLLQAVWCIVFIFAARLIWKKAIRYLCVQGG